METRGGHRVCESKLAPLKDPNNFWRDKFGGGLFSQKWGGVWGYGANHVPPAEKFLVQIPSP